MTKYIIIIAACAAISVIGFGVAFWSIYRMYRMHAARNSDLMRRVDAAIPRGTRIATEHRPPSPAPQPALDIPGRIDVLRPKAGDMLVFQADRPLTRDQRDQIREQAACSVPDGVKLVVLDAGMSVKHILAPFE